MVMHGMVSFLYNLKNTEQNSLQFMGSYMYCNSMNLIGTEAQEHQNNSLGGRQRGEPGSGGGEVRETDSVLFPTAGGEAPEAEILIH